MAQQFTAVSAAEPGFVGLKRVFAPPPNELLVNRPKVITLPLRNSTEFHRNYPTIRQYPFTNLDRIHHFKISISCPTQSEDGNWAQTLKFHTLTAPRESNKDKSIKVKEKSQSRTISQLATEQRRTRSTQDYLQTMCSRTCPTTAAGT